MPDQARSPHPDVSLVPGVADSRSSLLLSVQALLLLLIVAVFILTFSVQPFRIPSSSMVPSLFAGDFVLVQKQAGSSEHLPLAPHTIQRGDIIVFHFPPHPEMDLVKRVIGLPGDHVRLHASQVFINGVPLPESYVIYRPTAPNTFRDDFPNLSASDPEIDARWWTRLRSLTHGGELIIPQGQYFVLGDNRNESDDSRYWGLVPAGNILGRPLVVYFSFRSTQSTGDPGSSEPAEGPFGRLAHLARWRRLFHIVR